MTSLKALLLAPLQVPSFGVLTNGMLWCFCKYIPHDEYEDPMLEVSSTIMVKLTMGMTASGAVSEVMPLVKTLVCTMREQRAAIEQLQSKKRRMEEEEEGMGRATRHKGADDEAVAG